MENLTITTIQSTLHWEKPEANRAMFEEKIWKIGQKTDVIILPEMFSTGFSMNAPTLAEVMNLHTHRWMKQMAEQTKTLILGSFIVKDSGSFYNRLLWVEPNGETKIYDKRHLFRMAKEGTVYSGGGNRLVATWKGWNICPMVCYDLRFPVWSRNAWNNEEKKMAYDLLVYVASWPKPRVAAWNALLRARAIENMAYVAGVNRTGLDGEGVQYNGHSAVIDPKGADLLATGEEERIDTIVLDAKSMQEFRQRFPAYLDADSYRLD